jgi:hypothetical protein
MSSIRRECRLFEKVSFFGLQHQVFVPHFLPKNLHLLQLILDFPIVDFDFHMVVIDYRVVLFARPIFV